MFWRMTPCLHKRLQAVMPHECESFGFAVSRLITLGFMLRTQLLIQGLVVNCARAPPPLPIRLQLLRHPYQKETMLLNGGQFASARYTTTHHNI